MLLEEIKNNKPKIRNFIAKNAHINKAATFRDRKNDYKRKPKHKKDKLDH